MFTKIYFTLGAVLFLTVKGDPDPQTYIASTPEPLLSSSLQQPQYEEKNVIVYLTPEQITALQTGQGVLETVLEPQTQSEEEQQNQEQISQFELEQGIEQQNDYLGNQRYEIVQNQEEKEPAPVEEPSEEEPQEFSRYSSGDRGYKTPNSERNKYYAPTQKQLENKRYYATSTETPKERKYYAASSEKPERSDLKSYTYYSVYNQTKGDNINIKIIHPNAKLREVLPLKDLETNISEQNKEYNFLPYAYVNKKLSDAAPIQEANQRSRTSQKNKERQYAVLFASQSEDQQESQEYEQEDSSENEQNVDEELNESNYETRQNEQQRISDLVKKQNAQADAANVAKRPVVIKKVSITKQVPIPQPYIVHVPHPVVVNVPQPYPVPLEITRQATTETEDNEQDEERQAYKVKKTVRVPTTKKVYVKVDKPILVERIVPVETRRELSSRLRFRS